MNQSPSTSIKDLQSLQADVDAAYDDLIRAYDEQRSATSAVYKTEGDTYRNNLDAITKGDMSATAQSQAVRKNQVFDGSYERMKLADISVAACKARCEKAVQALNTFKRELDLRKEELRYDS